MRWKIYLAIFLLILVLTFVVQNTEQVSFTLLFWQFGLPRALLMLVVFLAGILTGLLFIAGGKGRQRKTEPTKETQISDSKKKG